MLTRERLAELERAAADGLDTSRGGRPDMVLYVRADELADLCALAAPLVEARELVHPRALAAAWGWTASMGVRVAGILHYRLTRECRVCGGYGTPDRTLYDTPEALFFAPPSPECPACGGSGRVWKWRQR